MLVCVKPKPWLGLWLGLAACQPAPDWIEIKTLSVTREQGRLMATTKLAFSLPHQPRQALKSGIPLVWQARLKVTPQSFYAWVAGWGERQTHRSLRIEYRALTDRYWITAGQRSENFASLSEALAALSEQTLSLKLKETDQPKQLAFKLRFLHEQLPLPLRPFAYFDPQWSLSTDWKSCPVPE